MQTYIHFTKMHGLGNDFMVIDGVTQNVRLNPAMIAELGDRHIGIGFDQLLLVEPPSQPDVDFKYRIFNTDGTEVENCGNGARCFARFVYDQRLSGKRTLKVETNTGILSLTLGEHGQVTINMGQPAWTPAALPFNPPQADDPNGVYRLNIPTIGEVSLGIVSMGNPHAVIRVDDVESAPVDAWGAVIESYTEAFPNKVNVGFMQVVDEHSIRLRVFERGVGETRACGTGACAAVVSGHLQGWLRKGVGVHLPGGELFVDWCQDSQDGLIMTGPTETVYEGRIRQ